MVIFCRLSIKVSIIRCARCEYKFETPDDLHVHQEMNVCGDDCHVDDDILSISGDEDTSTILNDLAGSWAALTMLQIMFLSCLILLCWIWGCIRESKYMLLKI